MTTRLDADILALNDAPSRLLGVSLLGDLSPGRLRLASQLVLDSFNVCVSRGAEITQ